MYYMFIFGVVILFASWEFRMGLGMGPEPE